MPRYRWPVLVWRDDAPLRVIVEDFVCTVEGVQYCIPAGYSAFDGASIPRWLWSSVGHPFARDFECAALVHDYFYDSPEGRARHGLGNDRKAVDELFYRHLVEEGVVAAKARMMYWGVQRFGESRFVCPTSTGLRDKSVEELRGLELEDCVCAQRESMELLAAPQPGPADADGRLLREGLGLLDFARIRANLEAFSS